MFPEGSYAPKLSYYMYLRSLSTLVKSVFKLDIHKVMKINFENFDSSFDLVNLGFF